MLLFLPIENNNFEKNKKYVLFATHAEPAYDKAELLKKINKYATTSMQN